MRIQRVWLAAVLIVICGKGLHGADADEASQSVYVSDMKALIQEVDNAYPFFDLKNISDDWTKAKTELEQRAGDCGSDEEFLLILYDAIRVLRDGHMGIRDAKAEMPELPVEYYPGISFLPATNGRVAIMHGPESHKAELTTGVIVAKIEGVDAREWIEQQASAAWDDGGFFSSPQRARLFVYRQALRGAEGDKRTISCLIEGEEKEFTLVCDRPVYGWPHASNLPANLKRAGKSAYHAKLDSGIGYIYLRRVDSSVVPGIDAALTAYPDAPGWIIDLRGNGGGGYGSDLFDRMKKFPRPVAVLIDAGCISAGETLARDFRAYAEARVFGSKSAGASSAKRIWALPSGFAAVSFSSRSRWRGDKQPIEFNGIEPDVKVENDPEELQDGKNSVILRAEEYILSQGRSAVQGDSENEGRD